MLSVITVAIPSTSTAAERGIEMFNIAAAAPNLAELGKESERLAQKYTGLRKLLPGSVPWSEAITGASPARQAKCHL